MKTPCFGLLSRRHAMAPDSGQRVGPVFVYHGRILLLRGEPAPEMRQAPGVELLLRPDEPWTGTTPNPERRAAVFCPGPSLRHWVTRSADSVFAVNAAADLVDADWVVSSKREPPWAGREGTFITTGSHPDRFDNPERDQIGTHPTTAAVALAAWLGHGRVSVYGDDRGGTRHYDGSPSHDSPGRWRREGAAFDALAWNLERVGCIVERFIA